MTADLCCHACRGHLGICRNRGCWHHIAKRTEDNKPAPHLYNDPTANFRTGLERGKGRGK